MVGAIVLAPPAIVEAGSQMLNPTILALGFAIGLLSSVIPYSFELIALRRIPPRVFSILMSLGPAAAALAAMMLLGEFLSLVQWLAMAASWLRASAQLVRPSTLDQPGRTEEVPGLMSRPNGQRHRSRRQRIHRDRVR